MRDPRKLDDRTKKIALAVPNVILLPVYLAMFAVGVANNSEEMCKGGVKLLDYAFS